MKIQEDLDVKIKLIEKELLHLRLLQKRFRENQVSYLYQKINFYFKIVFILLVIILYFELYELNKDKSEKIKTKEAFVLLFQEYYEQHPEALYELENWVDKNN